MRGARLQICGGEERLQIALAGGGVPDAVVEPEDRKSRRRKSADHRASSLILAIAGNRRGQILHHRIVPDDQHRWSATAILMDDAEIAVSVLGVERIHEGNPAV